MFYDRLVDSDDRLCFFEIVKVSVYFSSGTVVIAFVGDKLCDVVNFLPSNPH